MKARAKIFQGLAGLLLMASPVSLLGQGQDQSNTTNSGKPDVRVYVHKQTDQNGNVISYDTIVTYNFSGKGYSSEYLDSVMKNMGTQMNGIIFSLPLNTPDLSDYSIMEQFSNADFDKLQQMLEKQMNDMIQNEGMPPCCNGFFCQPPPAQRCCPKDSTQFQQQNYQKKSCPKHNKVKGGAQI